MRGFHVDRNRTVLAGHVLSLHPVVPAGTLHALELHRFDTLFPAGLTYHGANHLLQPLFLAADSNTDQEIELIFELVRRLDTAALPCRFESVFACESPADAETLRDEWQLAGQTVLPIWEVESDDGFRGDSELLTLEGNAWDVWERARLYWQGGASTTPIWELVLRPPVKVIARAG